jgi:hypothetical protein
MTDVTVPPIPLSLQHLPTVGRLVVPWAAPWPTGGAECAAVRWSTAPC